MRVQAFIETIKGSTTRTRYDESTLLPKETFQVNHRYPYDYGFLLGTNRVQKDCLDCYVITERDIAPGSLIECEIVGMIEMREDAEIDNKVLVKCLDEKIEVSMDTVYPKIKEHIERIFASFPETSVEIGELIGKEDAELFISANR